MLSVENKPFMLNVVMPSVVILSVVMLNVVALSKLPSFCEGSFFI